MPQDAKPNVKGSKKLPKAAIPIGAVAVVLIVLYLKKKGASETPTETNKEQLNRQSFIPVTGENVAGVGASGGGGVSGGGSESTTSLMEFFKIQQQENVSNRQQEQEWLRSVLSTLTGGGVPTGAPGGVVAAPAPPTQAPVPVAPPAPPPAPAPAPPAPAGCPPSFPNRGPHGCWRWSRDKTGQGCSCHGYQNGTLECEHKVGGRCTF